MFEYDVYEDAHRVPTNIQGCPPGTQSCVRVGIGTTCNIYGQFVRGSYKSLNLTVLGRKKKKKMHQFITGGGWGGGGACGAAQSVLGNYTFF